jgi:hypothetical protein
LRGAAIASSAALPPAESITAHDGGLPDLIALVGINLLKSQAYSFEADSTPARNALWLAYPFEEL